MQTLKLDPADYERGIQASRERPFGRVLFALYFVAVSGVAHIRRSGYFEGYARAMNFPVLAVTGWPAGVWLVVGALSIALGVWPDVGALMIGLFVLIAAAFCMFNRYVDGLATWAPDDPEIYDRAGFGRPAGLGERPSPTRRSSSFSSRCSGATRSRSVLRS